jgi:hypothetical protein
MFTIQPEPHAMEHIRERSEKLFLNSDVRIMELLESIQYGILYLVAGFGVGVALDYSMPSYNEQVKTSTLFLEISLQCLLLIIVTFYLRKLVKIMPFLFVLSSSGSTKSNYVPYRAEEYGGEVMIALVFLGAQFNLIKKLDLLSRRFYAWLYDEEKTIGESLGI